MASSFTQSAPFTARTAQVVEVHGESAPEEDRKDYFLSQAKGPLAVGEQLAGVLPWTELHKRQYSTPYSSSNDTTLRYIPIRVVKPDLLQAWRHWCYGFGAVSSSVLC